MFAVKVQSAAKQAGLELSLTKSRTDTLAEARKLPAAVILDLNNSPAEPLELIADLKSDPALAAIPLIGFVSHVQADLIQAARERGCETVLARSAFSQNLPAILARYA